MKLVIINVDQIQVFVAMNNDGIKINVDTNVLIDNGSCNKEFSWNPSYYKFEYEKLYDVGEYLHYENCKCRKKQ